MTIIPETFRRCCMITALLCAGIGSLWLIYLFIKPPRKPSYDRADDRILAINKSLFDANVQFYGAQDFLSLQIRFQIICASIGTLIAVICSFGNVACGITLQQMKNNIPLRHLN